MPSESELIKSFGVSRITVRQALRDLHLEGLIFTSQGKGTFASKPKATQDVKYLQGFAEAMGPKAMKPPHVWSVFVRWPRAERLKVNLRY